MTTTFDSGCLEEDVATAICTALSLHGYDFRAPGKFRRNNVTPAFATARDINDAAVFAL